MSTDSLLKTNALAVAVRKSGELPDILRPDVSAIVVSEWIVVTRERQRAFAEAFAASWEGARWPDGLVSGTLFNSTDGGGLLLYGQWTTEEDYQQFARVQSKPRGEQISAAVPGIERRQTMNYRLYRSTKRDPSQVPGCIVIVNVEFDGPDRRRQQEWVDTVFEALEAETKLPPGGIGGHFHLSTDGTGVLNYAEWADEKAHMEALDRNGGSIGAGPKWQRVRGFPGLRSSGVKRYQFCLSLVPQPSGAA